MIATSPTLSIPGTASPKVRSNSKYAEAIARLPKDTPQAVLGSSACTLHFVWLENSPPHAESFKDIFTYFVSPDADASTVDLSIKVRDVLCGKRFDY